MKLISTLILILLTSSLTAQQSHDSTAVKMAIYNPTQDTLHVLVSPNNYGDVYDSLKIVGLPPKDTTFFPFWFNLAEDQVPANFYIFSIFEAPTYIDLEYHDYWNCERIKDEQYYCFHTLSEQFRIDTSLAFDALKFEQHFIQSQPIYESIHVEKQVEFEEGVLQVLEGFRESIKDLPVHASVSIYVKVLVETDGSISSVEFIKSNGEQFHEQLTDYLKSVRCIAAERYGKKVRSTFVLPFRIEVR